MEIRLGHIPVEFKLGTVDVKVSIVDELHSKYGFVRWGRSAEFAGRIELAKNYSLKPDNEEDIIKGSFKDETIVDTYYHELAHMLVESTCISGLTENEPAIQLLGERLKQYCSQILGTKTNVEVKLEKKWSE